MRITLVRHGQTEFNYNNIIQGRSNPLLNDTGRRECLRLKQVIQDKSYDICYMSPFIRCVETAMILIGDRVKTVPDQRLIERDMGELEGRDYGEYNRYLFWDYDLNSSKLGVEPIQDIFKRCQEFLDMIQKNHKESDSILIVTHGSPYRALRILLLKKPLKGHLYDGSIKNCQLEEYTL